MIQQSNLPRYLSQTQADDQQTLKNLIERVQKLTNPEIAAFVGQQILQYPDVVVLYSLMSDEDLLLQAVLISSQQGGNSNPLTESKLRIKTFASTPEAYIDQCLGFIGKYKAFSSAFTQEFLNQFLKVYKQYSSLPLLKQYEILPKVNKIQGRQNQNFFLQELNLTDSALYYSSPQHRLRVTQVLAIYCFLYKPEMRKILLQILTGEGKSTTIACLAAILTMRGRDVDIITTNKILAKRDAEEKKQFFRLLGIKCATNIREEENLDQVLSPRKCYQKRTVVYGTPSSYHVDLLYDQYKKKGTRNKRPYDVAIIDEVDSMFIDQKQNQTLLASTYSGFAELKDPLKIIWQTIVTHNIIKENDKLYLLRYGQKKGDIIKGALNQSLKLIIDDIREKFKNDVINEEKLEFINISLDEWILSAIAAAHQYKQNVNYIVEDNKIIPVDFKNTGCLEKNTEWENGLHQFLQMKHDLPVSVQSLTSNFMSNIGHFRRYSYLYGLTGTLGSQKSMEFLQKTYQVQLFQIPSFHERRLTVEPGFVMYDYQDWINRILQRCDLMMKKNRAVLLICLSIQQANIIESEIVRNKMNLSKIVLMKTGEEKNSDKIGCRFIVIATNVAGRGTDLKASESLIKNGGLHVIITFVPQNLRVQRQAQGRAGRNGAPGSSQIIMNLTQYTSSNRIRLIPKNEYLNKKMENNLDQILKDRDRRQAQLMEQDEQRVQNLRTRDKLFEIFCNAANKISDYHSNSAKRKAIQQAWAMFLKRTQHLKIDNQEKIAGALQFSQEMVENSDSFYKLSHGLERGINELNKGNLSQAKKYFKTVQNEKCTKNVQIGARILQGATIIKQDEQNEQKILQGVKTMCDAVPIIEERKQALKGFLMRDVRIQNRSISQLIRQAEKKQIAANFTMNNLDESLAELQGEIPQIKIDDKMMKNLMETPRLNALEAIENHILKQKQKVASMNMQKQYLDIKFEPLTSLIDSASGKQQQLKSAFEELSTDIPIVATVEVKKKKSRQWKRAFVFALGVLQICIGALIVAATSGAAAGFGAFIIQSGIVDCMQALFHPSVVEDLKKYYCKKALEYGMAAIFAGTSALSLVYGAGLDGFSLIRNSSMAQIMSTTVDNIREGLVLGGYNFQALIQNQVFRRLSERIVGSSEGDKIKVPEVTKIIKQPGFQKLVKQGTEEEEKMSVSGKQIQEKFEKDAEKIIKDVIQRDFDKYLGKVKQLRFSREHIVVMINNSFVETFKKKFNYEDRDKIYNQIRLFLTRNYKSKTLASDLITSFKIDLLITSSLQKISSSDSYKTCLKSAHTALHNDIIAQITKTLKKYQSELQKMHDRLEKEKRDLENNSGGITVADYKARVERFGVDAGNYGDLVEKRKGFFGEIEKLKNEDNLGEKFIANGTISQGKINKTKLNATNLHPYLKQSLSNLSPFKPSAQKFKQQIQIRALDSFTGIVVKALAEVLDYSSGSVARLKNLESKLNQNLCKSRKIN